MVAKIAKLRSKVEQQKEEQTALLRELLVPYEDKMPEMVRPMLAHLDRQTASVNGWTFIMLSCEQNLAVVRWLNNYSRRPRAASLIWAELFTAVDMQTGEIMLSRDELAARAGISSSNLSAIMGELESVGAVSKHREPQPGVRGLGPVRYFMNPRVATHLPKMARDQAQAVAPRPPTVRLRAIEGGRPA